jgi:uncharacterized phosphosugar-binding protein
VNSTPMFGAYLDAVIGQLEQAQAGQQVVAEAASWIAAALAGGRPVFVFGASHAGLLAQDLFYRAGGLVPVVPIMPAGLMLNERPVARTSRLERTPGVAETFMADVPLQPGDVVVVISVSGRNPVPLEVCRSAQQRGARVIALTSVAFSSAQPSRGAGRLYEIADLTLDLPAVPGDAVLPVGDTDVAMGPTSSAVGAAMLHGLMCEAAGLLLACGIDPPVFVSGNVDGADQRNEQLLARFRDRIDYAG